MNIVEFRESSDATRVPKQIKKRDTFSGSNAANDRESAELTAHGESLTGVLRCVPESTRDRGVIGQFTIKRMQVYREISLVVSFRGKPSC